MNRRGFLKGLVLAAPAVILTPGLLMKIKPVQLPAWEIIDITLPEAYVLGASQYTFNEIIIQTFRSRRADIVANLQAHNSMLKRLRESA